jgi:hypothetical protein
MAVRPQQQRSAVGVSEALGEPILAGEPWHLGHDDYDRSKWKGPEHVR